MKSKRLSSFLALISVASLLTGCSANVNIDGDISTKKKIQKSALTVPRIMTK